MDNKFNLLLHSSVVRYNEHHRTSFSWMVCNANLLSNRSTKKILRNISIFRSSVVVRFPIKRLAWNHAILNHYIIKGIFCFLSFCLKMKVNVYKTRKTIFVHAKFSLNSWIPYSFPAFHLYDIDIVDTAINRADQC